MDDVLKSVAEFATGLTYDDLPETVKQAAKERLIDSVGCAIGSQGCDTAEIGRTLAGPAASRQTAGRIIGSQHECAADTAAFVNTCRIRYLDFNDTYPGGHPSDALGGLFAVAPMLGASGQQLITATVIAYELFFRHIMAANPSLNGFDQGTAIGMGLAAGLCNMMGLSKEQTAHAISMTTVGNIQLRATRSGQLSMWKGVATAYAVRKCRIQCAIGGSGHDRADGSIFGP